MSLQHICRRVCKLQKDAALNKDDNHLSCTIFFLSHVQSLTNRYKASPQKLNCEVVRDNRNLVNGGVEDPC